MGSHQTEGNNNPDAQSDKKEQRACAVRGFTFFGCSVFKKEVGGSFFKN